MANFPLPKGYQRLGSFPLDETEIFTSDASAIAYAVSPSAYPGQKISVINDASNLVDVYTILPDGSLAAIGGSTTSLSADNGLTITNNVVELGGTIDQSTNIIIDTYDLTYNLLNRSTIFGTGITTDWDGYYNARTYFVNGKFYINPSFASNFNGVSISGLYRLNANGSIDSTWIGGGNSYVNTDYNIKEFNNQLYISAYSLPTWNGSVVSKSIIRTDLDGIYDSTWNTGGKGFSYNSTGTVSSTIYTFDIQSDGKVIVAGRDLNYHNLVLTTSKRIQRLTTAGLIDASFNIGTGFNSNINKVIVLSDDKILVGGGQSEFNGTSVSNVVRLNSDGTLDDTFNNLSGIESWVDDIQIDSVGNIYVRSEDNNLINGTQAAYFFKLDSSGYIDDTWVSNANISLNQSIESFIVLSDDSVIVNSQTATIAGVRKDLVKLNSDGTLDTSFDAHSNNLRIEDYTTGKHFSVNGTTMTVCGNVNLWDGYSSPGIHQINTETGEVVLNIVDKSIFLSKNGIHYDPSISSLSDYDLIYKKYVDDRQPFNINSSTNAIFTSLSSAAGEFSFAMGSGNNASGDYSFSHGINHTTSGYGATTFGVNNQTEGYGAMTAGRFSNSTGDYSYSFGLHCDNFAKYSGMFASTSCDFDASSSYVGAYNSNQIYIDNLSYVSVLASNGVTPSQSNMVYVPAIKLNLGTTPPSPQEGTVYFNTTDKHFYGYNGTTWVQLDN